MVDVSMFNGIWQQILYYVGLGLLLGLVGGLTYIFIYLKQFKYKMTYWEVVGDVSKGSFTVDQPKTNKVKWSKDKTSWVLLKPFLKGVEIQPFETEYIYPGKQMYAFKINDVHIPAKIEVSEALNVIRPIPNEIRKWHMTELKQNEIEFAKTGWWEQNKYMVMTIIAVACCCGLAGVTVYYTYKFAAGGSADINNLANAIRGISTVGGKSPT